MTISPKAIDELKNNNRLKGLLAIAHECTVQTVERWIRKNDIKHLTTAAVLHIEIIMQETGFKTEDILIIDSQNGSD